MSAATPPGAGAGPGQTGPGQPGSGPPQTRPRRHQWGRALLVLLAIGVIVTVVILDRHALGQSVSALGGLDPRWFLLAIVCELVSLVAFGLSRRRLLRADGAQARFSSVMNRTFTSLSDSARFRISSGHGATTSTTSSGR